jgi:hypothetical protein
MSVRYDDEDAHCYDDDVGVVADAAVVIVLVLMMMMIIGVAQGAKGCRS